MQIIHVIGILQVGTEVTDKLAFNIFNNDLSNKVVMRATQLTMKLYAESVSLEFLLIKNYDTNQEHLCIKIYFFLSGNGMCLE